MVGNKLIDGLGRDDWELTVKELKSQIVQYKLALAGMQAALRAAEAEVKRFKPENDGMG